jgi:bifunctional polynucleotide phosphatase/kinase
MPPKRSWSQDAPANKKKSKAAPFDPTPLVAPSVPPAPLPISASTMQEVIVLVGSPGSGKSTLCRRVLPEYVRVNRDTLKTAAKCLKLCVSSLDSGSSVVVDNQSRSIADREPYVAAAKAAGVRIRAVRIDVPKEVCFHLNTYRALNTRSEEHRGTDRVPAVVIHSFFKNVEEPTTAEGFDEVVGIGMQHFAFDGCSDDRRLITTVP